MVESQQMAALKEENEQLKQLLFQSLSTQHYHIITNDSKFGEHYLYASGNGLKSAPKPNPCASHFKPVKNADGTFGIYSPALGHYLSYNYNSSECAHKLQFGAKGSVDSMSTKFEFFFAHHCMPPTEPVCKMHGGKFAVKVASIRLLTGDGYLKWRESSSMGTAAVSNQHEVYVTPKAADATEFFFVLAE